MPPSLSKETLSVSTVWRCDGATMNDNKVLWLEADFKRQINTFYCISGQWNVRTTVHIRPLIFKLFFFPCSLIYTHTHIYIKIWLLIWKHVLFQSRHSLSSLKGQDLKLHLIKRHAKSNVKGFSEVEDLFTTEVTLLFQTPHVALTAANALWVLPTQQGWRRFTAFHHEAWMRKYQYRSQQQRLPVLIGEGQDFMVKIKVFPLAAQREMVEH